jgi:hypothetical protein
MTESPLAPALTSVNWNALVQEFLLDDNSATIVYNGVQRVAIWSFEIQQCEAGNPALAFVREMQASALSVTATLALGLYKSAAASMRAIVESALYYSYFRTHPAELHTLSADGTYYLSRKEIVDYHKLHTRNFLRGQEKLGFLSKLEKWYSEISAIVHGQIPGVWTSGNISDTKYSPAVLSAAVEKLDEAISLVDHLFLTTVAPEVWESISPASKTKFTRGLSADQKLRLGLSRK